LLEDRHSGPAWEVASPLPNLRPPVPQVPPSEVCRRLLLPLVRQGTGQAGFPTESQQPFIGVNEKHPPKLYVERMATTFVFELVHVRHILQGLRKLREVEPHNKQQIDGVICWLKHQMVGKVKQLEPLMRNRPWIEEEIAYENNYLATALHECVEATCKKPCRGKFCADCWRSILKELHGEQEHTEADCKKV
jgi:hypothetical protein